MRSCGERVYFKYPVSIHAPEHVSFGNEGHIAEFVHIWGCGGVTIGDRVMIGSHAAISSVTHDHSDDRMFTSVNLGAVVIEDDVWIGTHAVVLPGVTIGKGAVVGAGAVVTRSVAPYTIVTGVPGRPLKTRSLRSPHHSCVSTTDCLTDTQ